MRDLLQRLVRVARRRTVLLAVFALGMLSNVDLVLGLIHRGGGPVAGALVAFADLTALPLLPFSMVSLGFTYLAVGVALMLRTFGIGPGGDALLAAYDTWTLSPGQFLVLAAVQIGGWLAVAFLLQYGWDDVRGEGL